MTTGLQQCDAFSSALTGTSYVVKDTADHIEDGFADHKPDFTVYDNEYGGGSWVLTVAKGAKKPVRKSANLSAAKPAEKSDETVNRRTFYKARVRFAWAISVIEVKGSASEDPFIDVIDQGTKKITLRKKPNKSFAQMTRYVVEIFLRQHREFVFTIAINGDHARLMRWDRCGAIVTESFNYIDDPTPLLLFVHWLADASRAQQGFDTSIRVAEKPHIEKLKCFQRRLEKEAEQAEAEYKRRMAERETTRKGKVSNRALWMGDG